MIRTEIAWAAGFYDADGNLRYKKDSRRTRGELVMQLTKKHRYVLDRFKEAVGLGKVLGPYKQHNYLYHVFSSDAIRVFDKISPFLSPVKKKQGIRAIRENA